MRHRHKGLRESIRSFADEICLPDAPEMWCKRPDPALLRLASGYPENVVKTQQGPFGSICIRGFGVVNEPYCADFADLFQAVRQSRKAQDCFGDRAHIANERPNGGIGESC